MTARKTQQDIDKTFKKIAEGIQEFETIYDKIQTSTNAAQKDKLEDNLKREIKKLQRYRDQIKTWAAGNEVKDKAPLLEQRKKIEKCMEQFKQVEKEMKTKAYSKEGLSQDARKDPEERKRDELSEFLEAQISECQTIIESMEAEEENIQVTLKKSKRDSSKADRLAEISTIIERYKWHEEQLELANRALRNGSLANDQIEKIQEDIEYQIKEGREADFEAEDLDLYADLNLENEGAQFGMNNDLDKTSSQDQQSIQDESEAIEAPKRVRSEAPLARRPSTQLKSPALNLATLHTMPPTPQIPKDSSMKPAPLPNRPPGEPLKYASAAAAAARDDKLGIAPLPPPPSMSPSTTPAAQASPSKSSETSSPIPAQAQPTEKSIVDKKPSIASAVEVHINQEATVQSAASKSPTLSQTSAPGASVSNSIPPTPAMENVDSVSAPIIADEVPSANGDVYPEVDGEVESIYHLPADLQDLIQSFETTKRNVPNPTSAQAQRMLQLSHDTMPDAQDAERPTRYKPTFRYSTPAHYPQEPLPIFEDSSLYETGRIDTDTLFYIFYYRQNTYQQYLAAKSLKQQSWRFHKQYQTWFQRHEEPKNITEEYEQGTYRFFDYESTW